MNVPDWVCVGHAQELVAADVVVNIRFVGFDPCRFRYNLCIDCAEAHADMVKEYDLADLSRVRDFYWEKHPNCGSS